jgi:acetoacetyl-CoA synthetase
MDFQDREILWKPSPGQSENSQMAQFIGFANRKHSLSIQNYNDLYEWSITHISAFWETVWHFLKIIASREYTSVVDDPSKMPGAKWFPSARLNYAENLVQHRDLRPAIIFQGERTTPTLLTYKELYDQVRNVSQGLRELGVEPGDRVVGFMPNIPETVIAMLATTAIGAIWSSSSPDFGIKGVLDRFSQIRPKIIFSADGYRYNGKPFDSLEKLQGILKELPSIEQVIITSYLDKVPNLKNISNAISFKDFNKPRKNIENDLIFEQLPFNHPLTIMYSSGTSGLPKSIVHGAGGTLIQHLKELQLHTDLNRDDVIFYYTTCGWMMWNWLVSSLAVGATIVLYDGSPFYPGPDALWKLADDLKITVFGTSAKYIGACEAADVRPATKFKLKNLRSILSTGSPLVEENFDYVYRDVKASVQLSSISGGTDIISCFALGNPMLPVRRGELQCRGLGMNVKSFSSTGDALIGKKGELVCTSAFPSMPIYFWNDRDSQKYSKAYFRKFKNIWHHGDYISISVDGGVKIFGRSDATLNPGGVRIGTAEIYRIVDTLAEVSDSLVIGQPWADDERIILFVKLVDGATLKDELINLICNTIRKNCTPRHVPAKVLAVPDIPYTINGKKIEIAVKSIIQGEEVENRDALANPEALDYFKDIPELTV